LCQAVVESEAADWAQSVDAKTISAEYVILRIKPIMLTSWLKVVLTRQMTPERRHWRILTTTKQEQCNSPHLLFEPDESYASTCPAG
jgi:hypothetical protein